MHRLLIRPGAIGDCILALPALEFLRADDTEVWVPTPVVPLVQFADRVCPISSTGLDLLGLDGLNAPDSLRDRLASFDEVISWYGFGRPEFRSALEAMCKRSVFYQALPPAAAEEHAIDFFARQVGAPAGLMPKVRGEAAEARYTVVIHPFSGSRRKNWPLAFFRDLSSALTRKVEWIAGLEDELPGAVRFDNLLHLAGWMRGASLYIGNDSGITHLAAAAGVRTLALFGPTSPEVWSPRGQNVTVLAQDPIEELLPATVLTAANRLLDLP